MHSIKIYNSLTITILSIFCIAAISTNSIGKSPLFHENSVRIDTIEKVSMMFMISHGEQNLIDLKTHPAFKASHSAFTFSTSSKLPTGLNLSTDGLVIWSPTAKEFKSLREQPFILDFNARNASNDFIIGQIRIIAQGELSEEELAELPEDSIATPGASAIVGAELLSEPEINPLTIQIPELKKWDSRKEGETFSFELKATGGTGENKFELLEPDYLMEHLDQYGSFSWTPNYDFTSPAEIIKSVPLKVKAFDTAGDVVFKTMQLFVEHVNRPPVVNELPTFYIQFNTKNTYQLNKQGLVYDPDGDSLLFNPVLKELPQGVSLNKQGVISWFPSRGQFNTLAAKPIYLTFTVEDYPAGVKTLGQIKFEVSQADLPPEITMMPNKTNFDLKENEELQLSFFITDPNGENDLLSFGFLTENSSINEDALKKKDQGQYEFNWTPGYDFIKEVGQKNDFDISFFAIDKESNRSEKNIFVTVEDAENLVEKDRLYYDQYRTVLERAYDLITQLSEKENELEKEYKHAKKGKKNRAITTASLGALTGLSPVFFIENPDGQKIAAGLGGTATATIGTLEASNVIGEPPSDIMRDLSYVSQKKNDLLVYGNIFASKYALPISKRDKSFDSDLRSLSFQLNLSDASKLELDAAWENSKSGSSKNIKRVFKDFNPDPRFEPSYDK